MTRFHREFVSCPHCLNEEDIVIWDQIDATTDPDLKDRLLRKKLQIYECCNCGRTHLLSGSILYRDDRKRLIVWCDPQLTEKDSREILPDLLNLLPGNDDYKFRLTVSANEMNEKIHLTDHGLDDRIMETAKLAVLAWQKEEVKVKDLFFLSANDERMLFLAAAEDENWYQLPVSAELYRQIEQLISSLLPEDKGWQKIDASFAKPYFSRIG